MVCLVVMTYTCNEFSILFIYNFMGAMDIFLFIHFPFESKTCKQILVSELGFVTMTAYVPKHKIYRILVC